VETLLGFRGALARGGRAQGENVARNVAKTSRLIAPAGAHTFRQAPHGPAAIDTG